MNDQALGETTPPTQRTSPTATPFGDPNASTDAPSPAPVRQWSIEDILATAKTPEKHARVCLRADLQAEHDQIVAELATLVDARGEIIDDDERAAGEPSNAARAQELSDRDQVVLAEMAKSMWFPLFRGKTTDELADFNKVHKPKNDGADLSEYNTLLVAECSVASVHGPALSVDDVRKLRKTLGSRAVGSLVRTAHAVCTEGGSDVPKLPGYLAAQRGQ